MNIFDKITSSEWSNASRLGRPARDEYELLFRNEAMARLNPNGFRTPPKQPRTNAAGKTRGDRKREARERSNAKIKDQQAAERAKMESRRARLEALS